MGGRTDGVGGWTDGWVLTETHGGGDGRTGWVGGS